MPRPRWTTVKLENDISNFDPVRNFQGCSGSKSIAIHKRAVGAVGVCDEVRPFDLLNSCVSPTCFVRFNYDCRADAPSKDVLLVWIQHELLACVFLIDCTKKEDGALVDTSLIRWRRLSPRLVGIRTVG